MQGTSQCKLPSRVGSINLLKCSSGLLTIAIRRPPELLKGSEVIYRVGDRRVCRDVLHRNSNTGCSPASPLVPSPLPSPLFPPFKAAQSFESLLCQTFLHRYPVSHRSLERFVKAKMLGYEAPFGGRKHAVATTDRRGARTRAAIGWWLK